jgi:cryptochrome
MTTEELDRNRVHPSAGFVLAANAGAVLHWFRRGLRLHDNPALVRAVSSANEEQRALLNVYIHDPAARGGALRTRFLYDSLQDLDRQLRERGSKLYVAVGGAADLLPKLADQFDVRTVIYEQETAAWARERDSKVCRLLRASQVDIISVAGHTLYDPQVLIKANGGSTPTSMTSMQHVMSKVGHPEKPLPVVNSLPPLPHAVAEEGGSSEHGGLPSWESFGVSLDAFNYRYHGGETVALVQMREFLDRDGGKVAAVFEKPNTSPAEFEAGQQDTTILSPHLALGTLSPRLLYHEVLLVQARFKNVSQPPVSLLGQLMFRELFHALMATNANFGAMENNPMCRQIEWDSDDDANRRWRRWENAQTGYPWIDALMTQLKTEGFMHHLGRHSVACFLTRGDLYVSWEKGQETFERYLIDWDEALSRLGVLTRAVAAQGLYYECSGC